MSDQFTPPYESAPRRQNIHIQKTPSRKRKNGTAVFILIVLISITAAFIQYFDIQILPDITLHSTPRISSLSLKHTSLPSGGPYIAVMYIEGVIQEKNETYSHEWLCSAVKKLAEDEANAGILLYVDSPGGTVYHADELYLQLNEYKKSGKNVWAYFGPTAASGGYYIACAAEKIFANRNTLTGSIGVIAGQSIDVSQLLSTYGVKTRTFTAGRNKNMLSLDTPLTQEHIDIMQSIADEAYVQFTNIVAEARKLNIASVINLADGRIYTASQALSAGLIDGILSFDDTCSAMQQELPHTKELSIRHFRVPEETTWRSLITGAARIFQVKTAAERVLDMTALPQNMQYPAYLAPGR